MFVSIGRVTSIGSGQVITTGLINLRRFEQRGGEVRVIAELLGRKVMLRDRSGEATIEDVAIEEARPASGRSTSSSCAAPAQAPPRSARARPSSPRWEQVREKTDDGEPQSAEQLVATYSDLLPADLAEHPARPARGAPLEVAEELPDERLADALEEMPEDDQVEILGHLDDERAADVLDQMQPDDAADLIAQLSEERGEALLELMEPEEADDVRFLLSYAPDTAGGLMTTEPIIVAADATVAEGLALIRRHELAPALGAAVCVTLPPYEPPTGRFLGVVHFQRMLRYPPHERLGTLLDPSLEPVTPDTSAAEVSRILASYNLVSLPVVDENHRLVGVVTIDDVLDYLLPDDWRSSATTEEGPSPKRVRLNLDSSDPLPPRKEDSTWPATTRNDRLDAAEGRALQLRRSAATRERPLRPVHRSVRPRHGHARGSWSASRCSSSLWLRLQHAGRRRRRAVRPARARASPLLTLILSLQASYAAPLILLAQNRQDDRDRVQIEQDRQRAERNLADTEYLAREVVALRLAMQGRGDAGTSSAPNCARCSRKLDKERERDKEKERDEVAR